MSLKVGDFDLQAISGGRFRMDGGAMFGVVPKVLWGKKAPPDERNRIPMATNCLLIRAPKAIILVDTGYGTKHPPRDYENFSLEPGNPLLENLTAASVKPEQI